MSLKLCNNLLASACLIICMLPFSAFAAPNPLVWVVGGMGDQTVKAQIFVEEGLIGKDLPIQERKTSSVQDLLSTYYSRAVNNNLPGLLSLHFKGDGSDKRLSEELQEIPDKFATFNNVKSIKLGRMYYWGSYVAVEVEWIGATGRLASWMELVYCESTCFLSDRLYKSTAEFGLFSTAMESFRRSTASPGQIKNGKHLCPPVGGCQSPVVIDMPLQALKEVVTIDKSVDINVVSSKYPVFAPLARLLGKAWAVPQDELKTASQLTERANEVLSCCWKKSTYGFILPFFVKSDGASAYKLAYNPAATFLQKLRAIDKIEIISAIESSSSTYVIAKVKEKSEAEMLQVFAIERNANGSGGILVGETNEMFLQEIIRYPPVISEIESRLKAGS